MKKIYAVSKSYDNGHKYFWNYFPTREAMQKMRDEEVADRPSSCELLVKEVTLPELKCGDINYASKDKLHTKDDVDLFWLLPSKYMFDGQKIFADVPVVDFWYDERGYWAIDHSYFTLDVTTEEAKQMIADYVAAEKEAKQHQYDKYLSSPFARTWLKRMEYTERTDEYGHKFLFLAIKCGYGKISKESFQKLCNAICMRAYGDDLRMTMWIGGKVNWTMFYQRPAHVNGHETYFCGVVGAANFSPEDFDRDHSEFSFANASRY